MRTGGEGSGESEEEVEKLRQELRQKEEELAVLRSRFNGEELDTVKVGALLFLILLRKVFNLEMVRSDYVWQFICFN